MSLIWSAIVAIFAALLGLIFVRPIYRILAPSLTLPPLADLTGIIFLLLALSPLSGAIMTGIIYLALLLIAAALHAIPLTNHFAQSMELSPNVERWVLCSLYICVVLSLFIYALHGHVKSYNLASRRHKNAA